MTKENNVGKNTSRDKTNKVEGVRGGFYTEEGLNRLKAGGRKGGHTTKMMRQKYMPRCRNVWCWVDEDIPEKWKAWKQSHSLFEKWEALDRELANSIERHRKAIKEAK